MNVTNDLNPELQPDRVKGKVTQNMCNTGDYNSRLYWNKVNGKCPTGTTSTNCTSFNVNNLPENPNTPGVKRNNECAITIVKWMKMYPDIFSFQDNGTVMIKYPGPKYDSQIGLKRVFKKLFDLQGYTPWNLKELSLRLLDMDAAGTPVPEDQRLDVERRWAYWKKLAPRPLV